MTVRRSSNRGSSSAIALIHQSGLDLSAEARGLAFTHDLWRVKNWEHHPVDPGWEDGRYCLCHRAFRNSATRREGEIIVDCVNDRRVDELGYPIRSYFEIHHLDSCKFSKRGGTDLVFHSYYFCDGESPFRLKVKVGPSGIYLTPEQLSGLMTHLSYHRYDVNPERGPRSIALEDWQNMLMSKSNEKARTLSRNVSQDQHDCDSCAE